MSLSTKNGSTLNPCVRHLSKSINGGHAVTFMVLSCSHSYVRDL